MTVRSVIISFFVLAFSFGMVIMNQVNSNWNSTHGRPFISGEKTPYLNYSDINAPTDRSGYNATMRDMTTYNKPSETVFNFDNIFQNIKYGSIIIDLLFNVVFGFPQFLADAFGMSSYLVVPFTIFLVINHILAVIYIVTGRTFIY